MEIGDGPAAVIPPFHEGKGTLCAVDATAPPRRGGKAAQRAGESEDLPEFLIAIASRKGEWNWIALD